MPRPRPKQVTTFERDRRRGIVTCLCLSAVLATAIIAGGAVSQSGISSTSSMRGHAFVPGPGELQSGAILFVPIEGNVCRRRAIDNETWRLRDDGFVTCDEAVTWNSGASNQKYFVAVRVDQIRAGFKTVTGK